MKEPFGACNAPVAVAVLKAWRQVADGIFPVVAAVTEANPRRGALCCRRRMLVAAAVQEVADVQRGRGRDVCAVVVALCGALVAVFSVVRICEVGGEARLVWCTTCGEKCSRSAASA